MAPEEGAADVCKPVRIEPRDGGGSMGSNCPPRISGSGPVVDPALPRPLCR